MDRKKRDSRLRKLCCKWALLGIGLILIFPSAHAGNNRHIERKILKLLELAEEYADTSGREALSYADSALLLSQTIDAPELTMAALKYLTMANLHIGDYDRCIDVSDQLLKMSRTYRHDTYKTYAFIGLGQANIMQDRFPVAKQNLDSAYTLAAGAKDDFALSSVYNGLGIYHMNADANYYRAIYYLLQGIEAAERSANERLHSLLLCNLSVVYYSKKDVAGLSYALECYRRGHDLNQSYLIFIGASTTAYCLFLQKKYDEALRFLQEAELLMIEKKYLNQANVYVLFGHIDFERGYLDKAKAYYQKALNESDQTQTSNILDAYLGLGKVALRTKHYDQALAFLQKGIDIASVNKDNAQTRRDLYYALSQYYQETGAYSDALEAFKLFFREHDNIFHQDREYHLSELMMKFEAEKTKNLLKEQDILLLKKERKLQILYIAIFIILVAGILLYLSNRRRNKRYMEIVRRNFYQAEQEKALKKTSPFSGISPQSAENIHPEKYVTSALSEEKSAELYAKLHQLMTDDKLYKDNMLTKDKLAEKLNTNRSYLSQVINHHTGLSYNHYINRLRIEEALRIISDPEDDTPLKAIAVDTGFNTLGTFYSAFQSIVGMPPSAYRTKMRELFYKNNHKD